MNQSIMATSPNVPPDVDLGLDASTRGMHLGVRGKCNINFVDVAFLCIAEIYLLRECE